MIRVSYTSRLKSENPYLPVEMSFLEIDNRNILLSVLKKSEEGNDLIVRVYNISPNLEQAKISLYEGISIKNARIVNLLEEKPEHEIKAKLNLLDANNIELSIEPHVIVTIRLEIDK